jgi:hypothetical protein
LAEFLVNHGKFYIGFLKASYSAIKTLLTHRVQLY